LRTWSRSLAPVPPAGSLEAGEIAMMVLVVAAVIGFYFSVEESSENMTPKSARDDLTS
jgi:hypothetical protein